jgi:hypothetical protein
MPEEAKMRVRIVLFICFILFSFNVYAEYNYISMDIVNEAKCRNEAYEGNNTNKGGQCKVFVKNIFNLVAKPSTLGCAHAGSIVVAKRSCGAKLPYYGDMKNI